MKTKDSRPRNTPTPSGAVLTLQERDVWGVLRPIYEHPMLPTPYVYEFAKPYSPSLPGLKNRLTDLTHEDMPYGEQLVRRLAEHPKMPDFDRHAIYDLNGVAEIALEEWGYKPLKRSYGFEFDPHTFMTSCTVASLELGVMETDLRWISRADLLNDTEHRSMRFPCTVSHNGSHSDAGLVPDDLFALEYPGPAYRLFAVECDRGNEPYHRANLDETSLHAKYLRYKKVIEQGTYKTHLNRKCGMIVLFIFTTTSKMEGFLERVEKEWNGGPCAWIAATSVPSFGKILDIPPVMKELLHTQWKRAGHPSVKLTEPKWEVYSSQRH